MKIQVTCKIMKYPSQEIGYASHSVIFVISFLFLKLQYDKTSYCSKKLSQSP